MIWYHVIALVAMVGGAVAFFSALDDRNEVRGLLVGMPGMFIMLGGACVLIGSLLHWIRSFFL